MTFPVYVRVGPVSVHPHWIFESLAYTVGFWWYRRARRRHGDVVDTRTRWWVIGAAIAGGFLGGRLLAIFENPEALAAHWSNPAYLVGSKTIVGGLIGGFIAVEWIKRRRGVTIATGDLLAVPLAVGIAIGRIGCFLSGLEDGSHGIETRLPWSVDFGDGVPRHPTQLYEIAFLLALAAILTGIARRASVAVGDRFKLFMVGYMSFRFVVEFLKPAPRVGGLSIIQWASLALIAYYLPHVPRLLAEVGHG
jgi:phosphatidylglycerol---prolipoprotein diacylglyceryl transferase